MQASEFSNPKRSPASPSRWPVDLLLVGLIYFCLARISLIFAFEQTNACPFWPPAGIALAAFLVLGPRAWKGIFLGAFFANFVSFFASGQHEATRILLASVLIACGNSVGGWLGWVVLGRLRSAREFTYSPMFALRLVMAAGCAGLSAALVGATALLICMDLPASVWPTVLRIWAVGDAVGIGIVAPLLLAWWCQPVGTRPERLPWLPPFLLIGMILFQTVSGRELSWQVPLLASALPVLALALGARRACWSSAALLITYLIWQTILGVGPFSDVDPNLALQNLQIALLAVFLLLLLDTWWLGGRYVDDQRDSIPQLLIIAGNQGIGGLKSALAVMALGCSITILAWWSVIEQQQQQMRATLAEATKVCAEHFEGRLAEVARAVNRKGVRWDIAGGIPEIEWRRDAGQYLTDYPFLQALEWLDEEDTVRWVEPLLANSVVIGKKINFEQRRRQALDESARQGRPVCTEFVTLLQGGIGFIMYRPVHVGGSSGGTLAAVINLELFKSTLRREAKAWDESKFSLQIIQAGAVVFRLSLIHI
jgi:integral membrane sensor domain MASE1